MLGLLSAQLKYRGEQSGLERTKPVWVDVRTNSTLSPIILLTEFRLEAEQGMLSNQNNCSAILTLSPDTISRLWAASLMWKDSFLMST